MRIRAKFPCIEFMQFTCTCNLSFLCNANPETASRKYNYKIVQDADLKGRYDYKCPRTHAAWGCVLPVYTLENAQILCDTDKSCKALVVIPHTSQRGMHAYQPCSWCCPGYTSIAACMNGYITSTECIARICDYE